MKTLWVYGVGLIGGSAAAAFRRAFDGAVVVGSGRSVANLETARSRGLIDRIAEPGERPEADILLVAAPIGASLRILNELVRTPPDCPITDAASVKGIFATVAGDPRWHGRYVPAHPIAGTEKSGSAHAFAELFDGSRTILTPVAGTDPAALDTVRTFWTACGSTVRVETAEHHDRLYASVSHMPHVLMYALAESLFERDGVESVADASGGGLRSLLRIAASGGEMWGDIFAYNRDEILRAIEQYESTLGKWKARIREASNGTVGSLAGEIDRVAASTRDFRTRVENP